MSYIELDNKKIYVRVIVMHNSSRTYLVIDDETKQQYKVPFEMLKSE